MGTEQNKPAQNQTLLSCSHSSCAHSSFAHLPNPSWCHPKHSLLPSPSPHSHVDLEVLAASLVSGTKPWCLCRSWGGWMAEGRTRGWCQHCCCQLTALYGGPSKSHQLQGVQASPSRAEPVNPAWGALCAPFHSSQKPLEGSTQLQRFQHGS